MRVVQLLPALNSGGVERGTVEFAAELVKRGHESIVVSSGGPLVSQLEQQGSQHIARPIHRKSPASFAQVYPMRRLLRELAPDIIHVRSRMPAWITWLAWRGLPEANRPGLVSTFHGMYSVNPYSAIMTRAQRIIAVSNCVKQYVTTHYPVAASDVTVIQRGVDLDYFRSQQPDERWRQALLDAHPELRGKRLIMMPGRLSRWKGQLDFLEIMASLIKQQPDLHGLVVGGAEAGKAHFLTELEARRQALGLVPHVTLLGQRNDMAQLYRLASLVCHLSTKPEPFGRTVTEALASGTPVAAYDRGGASETLHACFPQGLVAADDKTGFAQQVLDLLAQPSPTIELPERFTLKAQTDATLAVYKALLSERA
ncbi:MAG: glycosyltransferase family 4 protein [Marinobacter sp.]|nr:glycosyltransferase family 4 protein [Marinobacter sp.]